MAKKKIDNPLYGKIGAFWIQGTKDPFYGITEAKKYQYDNGGDILNYKGNLIIHDPEPSAKNCTQCGKRIHAGQEGQVPLSCNTCMPVIEMPEQKAKKKSKKGILGFLGL